MAKKSMNWLWGCGIGCGAAVVVVIILIAALTMYVGRSFKGFDDAVNSRKVLEERFGPDTEFVPWAGESIPAERVEAFLAVRDATASSREGIEEFFASIPMTEEQVEELESKGVLEALAFAARITGDSFGLIGDLRDLLKDRNQAMLDVGIGLGEYTYIYVMAYYSFLGHSQADGPAGMQPGGSMTITIPSSPTEDRSDEPRPRYGRWPERRIRRTVLNTMRNQLEAASTADPEGTDGAWPRALAAEIEAMEQDRRRPPWPEGPPPALAASLEPYRERLQASYSPTANAFELLRVVRRGWSITTE
jgi:hypothetical protein